MKANKTSKEYRKLNDFIRGAMRRKKVSQEELAYALNLTQPLISYRLSGKVDWTVWELLNVFEFLEVEFDYNEKEKT